jgi:hypothetical protein
MAELARFITLHDANSSKKKFPEGRVMRVRADSIDTLRPYPDGRARTVLGIHGNYLHVTETEDEILALVHGHIFPTEVRL